MKLARDNVFAQVVAFEAPAERVWLVRVLTYNAHGRGPFKPPVRVFDEFNQHFLAGLLPDVLKAAAADGVPVEVTDLRSPPPKPDPEADLSWLDEHQRASVAALHRFLRGIIKLPTGGGKTEVAVATMLLFGQVRFAFFAPREQLATQAAERWAKRTDGAPCGLFLKGRRDLGHRVTFATFQAVGRGINDDAVKAWLESLGGFFADEAHTCAAQTFLPVLTRCTGARIRAGLSATPLDRTDERAVFTLGALGPVVHEIAPEALVASGRIVAAKVTMLRMRQYATTARDRAPGKLCPGCPSSGDEPCAADCTFADDAQEHYANAYNELVVRSAARNSVLVAATVAAEKPALVFVRERMHGATLQRMLEAATGRDVPFVHGDTPGQKRTRIAAELNDGVHPVVIAGMVWEAGVDVPALRTVVNAAAGQSAIRTAQVLGRAVRADDGKAGCTVIDCTDDGEPVLRKHARAREKVYRRDGWTVEHADPPPVAPLATPRS